MLVIMHSHCIISPQKANVMVIKKNGFLSYKDLGNTSEIGFIAIKVLIKNDNCKNPWYTASIT